MSTNNELNYLETLVNEMREKEAQAKALQDEIDAVKSLIKDTMDTEGLSEVTTATHTIKYSECERTNIDKKLLQSEYPDIFGKVAKISKYKMLRIN